MSYVYSYDGNLAFALLTGLLSGVPGVFLTIGAYVFSSLALYTVAQRRGLRKPWLSWVPVVNCWILGSLSDQYRYVVRGENKSKRKILLVLNLLKAVFILVVTVLVAVTAAGIIFSVNDAEMMRTINGPLMAILGIALPLSCVTVACAVIRYMALYDIYKSMDPDNCVLFLIVSVLCGPVFKPTEGLFLFFNREKDLGMPPRREAPFYEAPRQEPWGQENKDYL